MSKISLYHKITKKASSLSLEDSPARLSSSTMHSRPRSSRGFTIVELLIVIIVIGILAAISIVAYNGISNKANNTAVQNDLSNFAKKIEMIRAETGEYPAGGMVHASSESSLTGVPGKAPEGVSFKVSQGAYVEVTGAGAANFIYCAGPVAGGMGFGITARSTSNVTYRYSSVNGLQSGASLSISGACWGFGYPRTVSFGYFTNGGGWQSWATGN